jgi:hypothetical protein
VDSAIVRMIPLAQPMACEQALLEQVVTKAFSQRRKVIRNCVAGLFTEDELRQAGVDPQAPGSRAGGTVRGPGQPAGRTPGLRPVRRAQRGCCTLLQPRRHP